MDRAKITIKGTGCRNDWSLYLNGVKLCDVVRLELDLTREGHVIILHENVGGQYEPVLQRRFENPDIDFVSEDREDFEKTVTASFIADLENH